MNTATQDSWKRLPLPEKKRSLGFTAHYTDADAELIMQGLIPQQMEDKWFIYFSEGWLYFLRSWTGAYIFALRLDGSPAGVRVIDSWVNRDPTQYIGDDDSYDRKLVAFLIDAFLLKKSAQFPVPESQSGYQPGVVQHNYVGRAYQETGHRSPGFWQEIIGFFRKKK